MEQTLFHWREHAKVLIKNRMNSEKKIEEIVRLMQRDDSTDAPQDSIKWARNLFRGRIVESKPSFVRRVIAVLQMDLSPEKPAFGERSASAAGARQMLFDAGENAIDLRIKKTEKGLSVHGQILGDGFEGSGISLEKADVSFETSADELSEFRIESIPIGLYSLRIKTDETEIVVEEMNLA